MRYNGNMHHAYVIEARIEDGVATALSWIEEKLGLKGQSHPDILVLKHGLFSIDDARHVQELAMQAPVEGDAKALVIAATNAYHESQNALLKLFEEPPTGTYLFFVLPNLGGLLPTLRSRTIELKLSCEVKDIEPESADAFLRASYEERSAFIKKMSSGRDDNERRERRAEALSLINAIERAAYATIEKHTDLLKELQTLRLFLQDRSAPIKLALEHLAIVTPRRLS